MAALGGIISAVGSAAGQLQQSQAASQSAQAQANAYQYNAAIAQQSAQAAQQSGAEAKRRSLREGRHRQGKIAATYLASGVTLSGSPLAVLGEEARQQALQAESLKFEKDIQATRFRNKAQLDQFYGGLASDRAGRIKTQGFIRAGTTLLGGIAKGFS